MQPDKTPLGRLGAFAFRRRRLVLAGWIGALVLAVLASGQLAGDFSGDYETPGSESKVASARVAEAFPGKQVYSVDVVWQADRAGSAATRERVDAFLASAQRLPGIADGVTTRQARISPDGTIGAVRVPISERRADDVPEATGERLIALAEAAGEDGVRIELGGPVVSGVESGEMSSEAIGFMVAAIVLLITFGTLVATGMPLLVALFGLGVSMSLGGLLAAVVDVPDWAPSVAAMIGIGVGIDYALLIVTRHRAALARGAAPAEAATEALATAGRSVLIAGGTVVISLLGLLAMQLNYMTSVALSAIVSVLVVMVAALTLLPALLGFAGSRINRLALPRRRRAPRPEERTPAARWSRTVQRRPWTAVLVDVLVLAALTAPLAGMRLGFPDAGNDPASTTTRQAYELTARGFGPGSAGPLLVVADLPDAEARAAVPGLVERLRGERGVAHVAAPELNAARDTALIGVTPRSAPQSPETQDLLHRLRDDLVPASGVNALVGGITASAVDQSEAIAARLPLFIGGVLVLSFLLLLAAFRAPVIAVKAAAMNLLSIGAAYGVVALVADGGLAGRLAGIDAATPVPPFLPVIMFAILFGLSMDYEVFLLSRIREEYLAHGAPGAAVVRGLARTARVITAAATIMVSVFGAFVLADGVVIKLLGVGLAAAVIIDATLVRMVLVPAVMQLLGARSWWLPSWLDRRLPNLDVEGGAAPAHS